MMENKCAKKAVKGFKVFNPDWTCKGFQYEVGKTYEMDESPVCCSRGFHFCTKASDCFSYYRFEPENRVAEVTALGEVDFKLDDTKCCTNEIEIVREVPWDEVLRIVNTGKDCTGFGNTGNRNTGNRNTGDCNTGDYNTGGYNTGDCNTGDYNTGDYNTGCFMTEEQTITMFNKPSDWLREDWLRSDARWLLRQIPRRVVEWVHSESMTDEEKAEHPTHETTGGYLKELDEGESGRLWWDGLSKSEKEVIQALPNFDPDIFEQCTGIKVERCKN